MQLQARRVLITGGSAGIGEALVDQCVAAGAQVILVARDAARAQAVLVRHPGRVGFLQADLARPDEAQRVVAEVSARWPDLAVLINNAGVQVNLPATGVGDDGRLAELRDEIAINLTAPVALCLGLMPLLARQPQAAIVNIASALAIAPKRSAPVYCATKAGLRGFTRALRYRCEDAAPHLRVVDVILPLVATRMTEGRGSGKMPPAEAARAILDGLRRGSDEVWVGKSQALRLIHRFAPGLAARMLRNG